MVYNPEKYWQHRGIQYNAPNEKEEELENLKNLILTHPDIHNILDIGSGYGRVFSYLLNKFAINSSSYTMCDFVDSMRYNCLRDTGKLPDSWDGKILPYKDNEFNLVISFSVLLHVPIKDIEQLFKEHARVVKQEGYIFVATYWGGLDKLAEHCFEHPYCKIFKANGLEIIDEKFFMDGLRVNYLLRKKEINFDRT